MIPLLRDARKFPLAVDMDSARDVEILIKHQLRGAIGACDLDSVRRLLETSDGIVSPLTMLTRTDYAKTPPTSFVQIDSSLRNCKEFTINAIAYAASMGSKGTPLLRMMHAHLLDKGMSEGEVITAFTLSGDVIIPALALCGQLGAGEPPLSFLMEIGAGLNHLNSRDETLLHVAAGYDSASAVKPLVDAGISLSSTGERGLTPIGVALIFGHVDAAAALAEAGADPMLMGDTQVRQDECIACLAIQEESRAFVDAWSARQAILRQANGFGGKPK